MSQSKRLPILTAKKKPEEKKPAPGAGRSGGPGNRDLLAGLGTGRSLPGPVQAKMESSLGADFSSVRLHESPLVAQGGAEAAASGSHVAFAPGKLNLGSRSGLELLGHELSHVASQARGEVSGSGLVRDAALERRADAEGAKAARAAGGLAPMSSGPMAAALGGPVQAKKTKKPELNAGDRFKAGFAEQDLPGQVESMRNLATTKFTDPDMDKSESSAYFDLIGSLPNEFIDAMIPQMTASAARLNQLREDMSVNNGEPEELAAAKGALDAKYSLDGTLFESYFMLLRDMSMGNDSAYEHYAESMAALRTEDPESFATIGAAQRLIGSNDAKNAWVQAHEEEELDEIKDTGEAQARHFGKNWHRPEAKKKHRFRRWLN